MDEETPLLGESNCQSSSKLSLHEFAVEVKALAKLAWPVIVSYLLVFTLNIASVFSLGHVGTAELAAIALATMLCNVTGFSVGMGMASALDTLCSQAHTGSNDPLALGKHLQRSIVVIFLISIPISILWIYTEPILLLAGQDPKIANLAGLFTFYMIPGLFPNLVADCLKRYLQAQGIMKPTMYITLLVVPINIFLQWLLVWSPIKIGIIGAPISTSIINIIIPLLTICYIKYCEGGESYGGWDWKEALDVKKLVIFIKLGMPGVLMLCAGILLYLTEEWWAYEVVALAAGVLGEVELAVQSIIINTASLFYMNSIGAAIASTTRVGNSLGLGDSKLAKRVSTAALIFAFCIGIFNFSILESARLKWGYLFTSDPKVISLVVNVLHVCAAFQLVDALGATCGGILRGCGRQNLGAILNFSAYYILGLPLSLTFAFTLGLGVMGLWLGLLTGQVVTTTFGIILILRTDWDRQVDNSKKLMVDDDDEYGPLILQD